MHVCIYLGTYINTCITYTALVLYVSVSFIKVHLSIDLLSLMGAYVDMHVKIYVKLHITRCSVPMYVCDYFLPVTVTDVIVAVVATVINGQGPAVIVP